MCPFDAIRRQGMRPEPSILNKRCDATTHTDLKIHSTKDIVAYILPKVKDFFEGEWGKMGMSSTVKNEK